MDVDTVLVGAGLLLDVQINRPSIFLSNIQRECILSLNINISNMKYIAILMTALVSSCGMIDSNATKKTAQLYQNDNVEKYAANITSFIQNTSSIINVNIPQNLSNSEEQKMVFSDVFDSLTVVKLSNTTEAFLGEIDKIEQCKGWLIISDNKRAKSVKAFDGNGNYLHTYGNNGKGPGEYIEPTTFIVFNGEVKIYDQFQGKLVIFDINGKYLRDEHIPFIFREFRQIDSNRYLFHCFMEDNTHIDKILDYMVLETDSSYVINKRGVYRKYDTYVRLGGKNLHSANDQNYIYIPFADTLYNINNDTINAQYYINYGGRKLSSTLLLHKNASKTFDALNQDANIISPKNNIFQLSDYLIFDFSIQNRLYYGFYNKDNQKLDTYNSWFDDMTYFFGTTNFIKGNNNYMIGITNPEYIQNGYKKFASHKARNTMDVAELRRMEKYIQLAEDIKDSDNLVLVFYYLKRSTPAQ